MCRTGLSTRPRPTASGARTTSPTGSVMARRFEYAQAEEIRDAFARHAVRFRSKEAAGRVKDREVLPRLRAFRDYWLRRKG